MARALSNKYSALQSQRFAIEKSLLASVGGVAQTPLAELQSTIAPDAAIIGWLDPFPTHAKGLSDNHWGVVVRRNGKPHWIRLPGSAAGGAWTHDDRQLRIDIAKLLGSFPDNGDARAKLRASLAALTNLRLKPLQPFLQAIDGLPAAKRLIVIPSRGLNGVPLQCMTDAYSISYAPSATSYVWLANRRRNRKHFGSLSMLALADPVFAVKRAANTETKAPEGLIISALPATAAVELGMRPGDVLVEVAGRKAVSKEIVEAELTKNAAKGTPFAISYSRDGKIHHTSARDKVAFSFSPLSTGARQELERDTARKLRSAATKNQFTQLPGARREVAAIEREMKKVQGDTRLLVGEEATESTLRRLNAESRLRQYRYLHFATHGVVNPNMPQRSALILSASSESDSNAALDDTRLTAGEMLTTWNLNAELVTLSACQTALGRYAEGEGHIGFAQSLLVAGADSVLLSLWKVDDSATALLMQRFYKNVLGTRAGLDGPLPKHEALREAQSWLRGLERADADRLVARIPQLQRGKIRPIRKPTLRPPTKNGDGPYADPYYWAAFVLVGRAD